VFDEEIEVLRSKRIQLIRKTLFVVVYSTLVVWALWLIYASITRDETPPNQVVGQSAVVIAQTSSTDNANTEGNVSVGDEVNGVAARKMFQQRLVAFETMYASVFSHVDFLQWLAVNDGLVKSEAVIASKEKALTLFANGAYSDAINMLKKADEMAVALEQSWHKAYEDKLQQAQDSYKNEDVKPAELYLNKALAIKPTDARGLSLQQQLHSYPRVAALLQTLNVAKVENNLQKQADTLQQIISADSTRTEWVKELNLVTQKLNDLAFNQAINTGVKAIEQRNMRQAKTAYQRAKAIYPQREEVRTLQKNIAQQQTSNNIQSALNKAEKASQADDWQRVLTITQSAGVANASLQKYKQVAQNVLQAQRSADNYLSRPERLQDQNVRAQAKKFVSSNITTTLKSPAFAAQLKQLSEKIAAASLEQDVQISSNGKTDIWVLSVGHVGVIQEKTIRLKPGSYILEGRCAGYRNKQLAITVSSNSAINSTNKPIHMVCDERI
jgi:hypothetical protein